MGNSELEAQREKLLAEASKKSSVTAGMDAYWAAASRVPAPVHATSTPVRHSTATNS